MAQKRSRPEVPFVAAAGTLAVLLHTLLLLMALFLPRLLAGTAPSAGQILVFFLIGAVAGYIAELVVRGMRPFGYAGSILAGMIGAWIASNLLPRSPVWDYPISTTAGNVPILTAFGLALVLAVAWRLASGSEAFRRPGSGLASLSSRTLCRAEGGLLTAWLAGFLVGCTVGWGIGTLVFLARPTGGVRFWATLCVVTVTVGGCWIWHRLFLRSRWRFFGRPLDRSWTWAALGLAAGLTALLLIAAGVARLA
jgi:uncharacterized membrane protein YeaQ/YmgE (transglycosylase-associated protein family)